MRYDSPFTITNVGPQPRDLSDDTLRFIASQLIAFPPHDYEIETNSDDPDGGQLGYRLTIALNEANWNCVGHAKSMFPHPMYGITVLFLTIESRRKL